MDEIDGRAVRRVERSLRTYAAVFAVKRFALVVALFLMADYSAQRASELLVTRPAPSPVLAVALVALASAIAGCYVFVATTTRLAGMALHDEVARIVLVLLVGILVVSVGALATLGLVGVPFVFVVLRRRVVCWYESRSRLGMWLGAVARRVGRAEDPRAEL